MRDDEQTALLRALRALRWPLAGVVGLVFALGRLAEGALLLEGGRLAESALLRALDSLFWGLLAAGAVWIVLSWAARQEQRYRAAEARMLAALRESNAKLELLNEINQRIASSATLDEVLDYAISLPGRLIRAQAATLVLYDETGAPLTIRSVGLAAEALEIARAAFPLDARPAAVAGPQVLSPAASGAPFAACLVLPLVEAAPDGKSAPASLGWIEAYLSEGDGRGTMDDWPRRAGDGPSSLVPRPPSIFLPENTVRLLITVAGELTEALIGARRRARELASIAALEQAITEERTRIARDLHDGIAQSLAFMRMRVDLWEDWLEQDPPRLREEFAGFKANLRLQIEELRRAIFALRPVELSQLGFEGALRRFVTDFAAQQGWDLDLDLSRLPHELPHLLELASFRVVQEALNNAAKHARASHVCVGLGQIDGGLQIVVRDNGAGFDPGRIAEQGASRLGLRQMRERIAALDGQLTLLSRPGAGAELRAWLPIVYAASSPAERDAARA